MIKFLQTTSPLIIFVRISNLQSFPCHFPKKYYLSIPLCMSTSLHVVITNFIGFQKFYWSPQILFMFTYDIGKHIVHAIAIIFIVSLFFLSYHSLNRIKITFSCYSTIYHILLSNKRTELR